MANSVSGEFTFSNRTLVFRMDGLQYAVLEAPIVLASYQNKLIDLYDSNKLFDYLSSNAGSHDMILCNADGLCFHNPIPVQETICESLLCLI